MERSPTFSKWVNEEWKNPDGNKIYPLNEEENFDYFECQDADYLEFWGVLGTIFDIYLKKIYKQRDVDELKNFFKIIEDLLYWFSKTSQDIESGNISLSELFLREMFEANIELMSSKDIKNLQNYGLKDRKYYEQLIAK